MVQMFLFVYFPSTKSLPPRGTGFSLLLKRGEGQYVHLELIRKGVTVRNLKEYRR
jgi:hypothetical protein